MTLVIWRQTNSKCVKSDDPGGRVVDSTLPINICKDAQCITGVRIALCCYITCHGQFCA